MTTALSPEVKRGPHAYEKVYSPSLPAHGHGFPKREHFKVRETIRLSAEARNSNVIGHSAHLRAKRGQWFDDQRKAADTCVVSGYVDGMGLRLERRLPGYSWEGKGNSVGSGRGRIKKFSRSSAARLRDRVWQMRKSSVPVMVTLTYLHCPSPEEAKRDLDSFLKALKRKYPKAAGVWKLEPQKRGVPHYHLLVWNASPWMRWVAKTWFRIVGSGDPRHLAAGTRVEKLRSYRGTLAYVGKNYLTKECGDSERYWGRYWGVFNAKCLPYAEAISERCPGRLGVWIARTVRRWMRARSSGRCRRGGRGRVVWITTDFPGRWLECFDYLDKLICK